MRRRAALAVLCLLVVGIGWRASSDKDSMLMVPAHSEPNNSAVLQKADIADKTIYPQKTLASVDFFSLAFVKTKDAGLQKPRIGLVLLNDRIYSGDSHIERVGGQLSAHVVFNTHLQQLKCALSVICGQNDCSHKFWHWGTSDWVTSFDFVTIQSIGKIIFGHFES